MQFKDQLGFIAQHMKRNKLRMATTILAATMGCAFLIVLASVGFGLHKTLSDDILENRTVTKIEVPGKKDSEDAITVQEAEAMREIPHVKAVAERSRPQAEGEARLGERSAYADLVFVQFENEEKAGLALSEGAMPSAEGEVLVGYHFASSLLIREERDNTTEGKELDGFAGSLIGQTFEIELKPYEGEGEPVVREFMVAGVTEEPAKDWMMDSSIYADESWSKTIAESLGTEETPHEVLVYADELQYVEGITEKLKRDGYYVYSVTEELGSMNMFFTLLKAGLIFVGTIAILIASIGIFNTMTMAVTERTREIGVMKAIGAQPKLIQRLFLMESAAIGIIGTFLAVIIAYGISMLANWLVPMIVMSSLDEEEMGDFNLLISVIPWQLVAISSAISIGVAMVSGWRPARKATQINVIQALRQEL
ncbi:MAG TPA: FtsX-like permease family protein [Planococcus sp. (in: firmicutes)]|nr:FtsX-like permease family protein [Planococcus sp. (in: firmicutes)]